MAYLLQLAGSALQFFQPCSMSLYKKPSLLTSLGQRAREQIRKIIEGSMRIRRTMMAFLLGSTRMQSKAAYWGLAELSALTLTLSCARVSVTRRPPVEA